MLSHRHPIGRGELDSFDIYEERIWMLYKNVCKQDIIKTIACLRGCQLGIITENDLNRFIDNKENTFVPDELLKKVQTHLPEFGIINEQVVVEDKNPK